MNKAVNAWANRYFNVGLGFKQNSVTQDTELIESMYNERFMQPLINMLGEINKAEMNAIITHMNNVSPHQWPYILNFVANNGLYVNLGDFNSCWSNVIKTLEDSYVKRVATVSPMLAEDIEVYYDETTGTIIGDYPYEVYVYPVDCCAHRRGRYAHDVLSSSDLLYCNELERRVIRDLRLRNMVDDEQIMVEFKLPDREIQRVPLTHEEVPPYSVLRLIRNLPPALVASQGGDEYKALRAYVESTPAPLDVIDYVEMLFKGEVSEVDFYEGTLDDLIRDYCTEQSINLKCTIEQLIQYINVDCVIKPQSLINQLIEFKAHSSIPGETTIDELIAGQPHKFADGIDATINAIKGCDRIPEEQREALVQCFLNDADFQLPSKELTEQEKKEVALEYLRNCESVDDNVRHSICDAIETRTVMTSKDFVLRYLPKLDIDADTLSRLSIAIKNDAKYEAAPTVAYDESGYRAGELLLRETRKSINEDPSFKNRERLTEVLYSFLRLLMCDLKTETNDVREFLSNKITKVDSNTAELLKLALKEI